MTLSFHGFESGCMVVSLTDTTSPIEINGRLQKITFCYIISQKMSVTMQDIHKKGMTPQHIHDGVNTHNDFIMSKNTFKKLVKRCIAMWKWQKSQ